MNNDGQGHPAPEVHEANLDSLAQMFSGSGQPEEDGVAGDEVEELEPSDIPADTEDPESLEDEGDTEEVEDEEIDVEGEEPTEDVTDEAPVAYEVSIEGEKHEATIDELVQSFEFRGMTTRRRQKEAELHKQAMGVVTEKERVLDQKLEQVEQFLGQGTDEFSYESIADLPPEQQRAAIEGWSQKRNLRKQVDAERAQLQESQRKELERYQRDNAVQEERALITAVPEWADERVLEREMVEIGNFAARQLGFSEEELGNIAQDHRSILALRFARAGYEAQRGVATVRSKAKRAKRIAPGSPSPSGNSAIQSASDKKLQRLKKRMSQGDTLAGEEYFNLTSPGYFD